MITASLTLHPCVALAPDGFIPAIKVIKDGAYVSTHPADHKTFTRAQAALAEAWDMARRMVAARPEHFAI